MEIEEGMELPARVFTVTREDLIRYAGASGDFNVIHWNERVAKQVGLPDVIAHGMFTMGLAIRCVTEWCDDPSALVSYGCRFTRPVVVPDNDQGARVEVTGTVASVADGVATVSLRAVCDDVTVLGKATATIKVS